MWTLILWSSVGLTTAEFTKESNADTALTAWLASGVAGAGGIKVKKGSE